MFSTLRRGVGFISIGMLLNAGGVIAAGKLPADPMRPADSAVAANGSVGAAGAARKGAAYTLNAIRIGEAQHRATINGKNVTVGEKVDGARVVAIEAQSVTLLRNGKKVRITLLPLSVKQKVEAKQP